MQQITKNKTIFQFLFVPGLILNIAGLIAVMATQEWTILYLIIFSCGNMFLFAWIFFHITYIKNLSKRNCNMD